MDTAKITFALPKGHMYEKVSQLMEDAGFHIISNGRNYRPICSDSRFELKMFRAQNIVQMVDLGRHDIAFAGHDWVVEGNAKVVELLDTGFDSVRVVAAIPESFGTIDSLRGRRIVVASEYERITRDFLDSQGLDYFLVHSYGATEVFPPEDADLIVDNTATGRTLRANGLKEVAVLLSSSTRLIANPQALTGEKGRAIDELVLLLQAVLDARRRVMLEMNVETSRLKAVLAVLPCMRHPTMSALADNAGYAIKAAVLREEVARLIPVLKTAGATDILEYPFSKVVL
jgi:ATP phosphoribosyltransferase